MFGRPSFAGSGFVFAENENDDVRFLSDFDGFRDALRVFNGIAEFDFVGVPIGKRFGDLRAFGVENFGVRADARLDAVENGDAAAGLVAVAAEVHVVRVGADDGDVFVLGGVQRKKIVLIFQQRNGFARGL